jgi:actin-like protein 6B
VKQYEFTTGYNNYFGAERFAVGELLFNQSRDLAAANTSTLPQTLPQLLGRALQSTDQDMRGVLLTNIVLTGGGSLLSGAPERLQSELARQFPHVCYLFCLFRGGEFYTKLMCILFTG